MISFLIVNWNGGVVFKNCIHSIEKNVCQAGMKDYEIIVVDNHSSDLDEEWLLSRDNIRLVKNNQNLKFAVGTNQSVENSNGDMLFFLNNDVILCDNSLSALIYNLSTHPVHAVVPKLRYPDGDIQYSIRGFPTITNILATSMGLHLIFKEIDTWLLKGFDYTQKQFVSQPMFSALLIKRSTWDQVGKMDEAFPLLFNDVDWFFRFNQFGMRCLYIPEAKAVHVHGMSVNRNNFKKVFISIKSMILFFRKHQKLTTQGFVCLYGVSVFMALVRITREIFCLLESNKRVTKSKVLKNC